MPAFTSRLNLYKPGGGSSGLILPDEVLDVDRLNTNFDAIDAAVGARVVTSGTRPASPYNGQAIYESDTGNIRVWNSGTSRWELPSPSVVVADFTALAALSTAVFRTGDVVYVTEGNVEMRRVGSSWVQVGVASFATTAARDTAYAKASGAYRVTGARCLVSGLGVTGVEFIYVGSVWEPLIGGANLWTFAYSGLASSGSFANTNANAQPLSTPLWSKPSPSVYQCDVAGLYSITLTFEYAANVTGNRGARLVGSGSLGERAVLLPAVSAAIPQQVSVIWQGQFAVNDTVTTTRFQNSGVALDVTGSLLIERIA